MQQEHRPRHETRKLIFEAVRDSQEPPTRTQIARALNRTKTPHLIAMIDEMVDEGILTRSVRVFNNGVQGYVYSVRIAPD